MPTKKADQQVDTETGEIVTPAEVIDPGNVTNVRPEGADNNADRNKPSVWRPDFDTALPVEIEDFIAGTQPDDQERDPEAVALEIMTRILRAKSVDEVFQSTELRSAGEILQTPLTVSDVKWNRSDFADGPGVYAVVDAWDHVMQSEVTISVGGINAIAQLYQLKRLGALPLVVQFEESPRPTTRGRRPLWLRLRTDVPAHVADAGETEGD